MLGCLVLWHPNIVGVVFSFCQGKNRRKLGKRSRKNVHNVAFFDNLNIMKNDHEMSYIQADLKQRLKNLDKKITELENEKRYYENLLSKSILEKNLIGKKLRENSKNRIIFQNMIIECINSSKNKTKKSIDIYNSITKENKSINKSTFRSYIRDLKEKGLIKNTGIQGVWTLPDEKEIDFLTKISGKNEEFNRHTFDDKWQENVTFYLKRITNIKK